LEERRHATRGGREGLRLEVLRVWERAAEVDVRIDKPGKHETAARVDARLRVGQRVDGTDRRELAVAYGGAAFDDTARCDEPRVRDQEIRPAHARTLAT
jgi:hypothetical protein